MEEVLSILRFSRGASVGMSLIRWLGGGARPVLVGLFKAGLAAGEVARSAASGVGGAVAGATAGARENLSVLREEATTERRAARSGGAHARSRSCGANHSP